MKDRSPLRAVGADEKPKPRVLSLDDAIDGGDPLEIALAQRRDIVAKLKDANGPAAAALHRQLSLTSDRIESLEAREQQEDDPVAHVEDGKFDSAAI